MPIFTRRVLQKILDENRKFLAEEIVKKHVRRLNSQDKSSLSAEWEVILLNALSRFGHISHEEDTGGKSKLDIIYESSKISFCAEIITVSDDNYHEKNPVDFFCDNLERIIDKCGLPVNNFDVMINSVMTGQRFPNKDVSLKMPPKKDIPRFTKTEIYPFLIEIRNEPMAKSQIEIASDGVDIKVTYDPNKKSFTVGHTSYSLPYSLVKNPLYNALKKKIRQIKDSKYSGITGIFVCDGGCEAIRQELFTATHFTKEQIIRNIFENHYSISFVILLTVNEERPRHFERSTKYIKGWVGLNPYAKIRPDKQVMNSLLNDVLKILPQPESTPINARNRISVLNNQGLSFHGGFRMSGRTIKISSRMLTELLSGNLETDTFDAIFRDPGGTNFLKEFFKRQIRDGCLIEKVCVEHLPDKDDDWIIFQYGESDPAISEFK